MKVFFLKFLLVIVFIVIIHSYMIFYANTHPPRETQISTPKRYDKDYDNVVIRTYDGVTLKGWFVNSKDKSTDKVIIICHGAGASKSEFVELAVYLSDEGYNVLLFDFRAHGESGGDITSIGYCEQNDLEEAINYIKEKDAFKNSKIGVYGFSLGGSVAIMTAAKNSKIDAIVAESPFSDLETMTINTLKNFYKYPKFPIFYLLDIIYKLRFKVSLSDVSPKKAIDKVKNIMIIAGTKDKKISIEDIKELYASALEPKKIWIVKGAGHGKVANYDIDYYKKIKEFFDSSLAASDEKH